MNRQTFLAALKEKLTGLPQEGIDERISFYGEMIDDRIEEGLTEEQAIEELGTVDQIAAQIMSELPPAKPVKDQARPSRTLRVWEIVLLILGSPIWLSLLIALSAVVLSIYTVIWSLIVSLWAIEFSIAACSLCGVFASVVFVARGNPVPGAAMLGMGILCAGLSIFGFYGCRYATAAVLKLSKKLLTWIRSCFMKKEAVG